MRLFRLPKIPMIYRYFGDWLILYSCQDKTQPSNHHLDNIATSLT
ncbi:hypothetical protein EJK55_1697 [Moraxella catarrhalis]|uniref:Uncharacterized protein n=1 Tax=Moraxella catarrhalis TaxID=480 RepID=A0ABY0BK79_MORCA|nr:hypothetical protein MCR_1828 [Moraxella catarrhalis BBH18]AZQ87583.1 hypothetical protein EJK52_1878 [Moraxella catarrhalis]AZQ89137.1 hypothetical protein EJK50_1973 [Moraxella catarrhalis]AZQ91669.1 hypothetical protein EJK51_1879 [Moraxella catarrhalis]AZQ95681.1 hypothetical protein EJK48_1987 [Moraxella catarrhalis]